MEEYDEIIQKFHIKMLTPQIDQDTLQKATFIMIRHAFSQYNFKAEEATIKYGEDSQEMFEIRTDPALIDPDLHPIGRL